MIHTDDVKHIEYQHISTDDVKDEQFRKKLESIPDVIKYIRNKKIDDFENQSEKQMILIMK